MISEFPRFPRLQGLQGREACVTEAAGEVRAINVLWGCAGEVETRERFKAWRERELHGDVFLAARQEGVSALR